LVLVQSDGYSDPTHYNFTLPFPFFFFCDFFQTVYVTQNGWVKLDGPIPVGRVDFTPSLFPLPNSIAVLWDFWVVTNFTDSLYYDVSGSPGSMVITISWLGLKNAVAYDDQTDGSRATFQLAMFEETGDLQFRYNNTSVEDGAVSPPNGAASGVSICGSNNTVPNGNCISYSYLQPIIVSPLTLNVTLLPPSGNQTVPVADAGGPYEGFADSPVELNGSGSQGQNLYYQWTVSSGEYPAFSGEMVNITVWASENITVNLTVSNVEFSSMSTANLFVGAALPTPILVTVNGDGDGTVALAVAFGVAIPLFFLLIVAAVVAAVVIVFMRRHILESGGKWWSQEDIYAPNLE